MWECVLYWLVVMRELKTFPPHWETCACRPLHDYIKLGYMFQRSGKHYILCFVLRCSIIRIANALISLNAVTHTVPSRARRQYKYGRNESEYI